MAWNAQLGHGPKISIFHNLVSEKASSTLTVHTVESFPAIFCFHRPWIEPPLFVVPRSRPKIADSRVHPRKHSDTLPRDPIGPPRPHFIGWITANLGDNFGLCHFGKRRDGERSRRWCDFLSQKRHVEIRRLNRGKFVESFQKWDWEESKREWFLN